LEISKKIFEQTGNVNKRNEVLLDKSLVVGEEKVMKVKEEMLEQMRMMAEQIFL
jgi:hypothetical protein